ncbi:MAG: aminopeptidase P family protein [Paludibacteraceae bacterium]|nr:aminopeptidase P family protein [Paludibacteraceae bacterium]HOH95607.1 aminopeptidase P family protein [Candidatus Enterocola sp.]
MSETVGHLYELRCMMKEYGVSACLIPQADPHQSEYLEDHYKVREYFSGFTGSAGLLAVSLTDAGLWTDSRYYLQASEQLQLSGIKLYKQGLTDTISYDKWLYNQVGDCGVVVVNANNISVNEWIRLSKIVKLKDDDSFEGLWLNRPTLSDSKIFIHDVKYSGKSVDKKLTEFREAILDAKADCCILTVLDEIAWLLNIRAFDVPHNPVVRSYLIVNKDECILFVDLNKLSPELVKYFAINNISVREYDEVGVFISNMQNVRVLYDADKMSFRLYSKFSSTIIAICKTSFVSAMKAVKNDTEIRGFKNAMKRDGVVWVKFLRWFELNQQNGIKMTERSVMNELRKLKSEQNGFVEESFETTVGYGKHAAIVHYAATEQSDAVIKNSGLLLIDTGTQYLDGTTDTTRTLACGSLTQQERIDYTLVLKGHIALAQAIFPLGTKGSHIDILARQYLWQKGLDYGHGTGHGVGHFLNVHEGYARISPRENGPIIEAGFTFTNEPGLYREGCHGIRIENMLLVVDDKKTENTKFLRFETLTLVPIDMKAIDLSLLDENERNYLNNYHKRVITLLSPLLNEEENNWLKNTLYEI